jgi:hypothetical protein
MKRLNKLSERCFSVYFLGVGLVVILLFMGTELESQVMRADTGLVPSPCDDLETLAASSFEPELIEHNERTGMFFSMDAARYILCAVQELRSRRQEIELYERELSALALQIELGERQLELSNQANNQLNVLATHSLNRAREADERANKWYRSPLLWFCIGIVLSVGLLIGSAYLFV